MFAGWSSQYGARSRPPRAWTACAKALLLIGSAVACAPTRADTLIYDDALENGFVSYSYVTDPGIVNFASTTHFHAGSNAIAFTAGGFDAVKFANNTTLFGTATTPRLHLWFYGSQAQCQGIDVILERNDGGNDAIVASGALSAYANNCLELVAGQWFEISVELTALPIAYSGTFDRISLFNRNGGGFGPVWFDDLSLQSAVVDPIFKSGFEGDNLPPPACGMTDEHDVTAAGMLSDRFDWCDAAGQARVAVLAHNNGAVAGPGGTRGGELREFRYETGAGTRIVAAPARGDGGFGYIVSHPRSEDHCVGGDSSSLGHFFTGSWTRVFEGRHHAILRFQQNYPRYCTVAAPAAEHDIPVTIDWVFSTGRDDPLWAVTFDMSGFGSDLIDDDSRAPYGTLDIDGSAGAYMDNDVAGIGWGDRRRFSTTGPATLSSSWSWSAANAIPFVELWTSGVDATMGLAQSQPMSQQDAGGGRQPYGPGTYDVSAYWGATSAGGQACADGSVDQQTGLAHSLPCVGLWPYQINSFSYDDIVSGTNDAKITWGTQYGFLGQQAYNLHDSTLPEGSTAVGWPKKSYSVYVVLGKHNADPLGTRVAQVEALQTVALGIVGDVGSVATSGPAGINRADTVNYSPPGYDPVYGALAFNASSNALDANIAVGAGTLINPLIVVRGYASASYPATVSFKGVALVRDVDYFPSLRAAAGELWITLNRNVTGASNELQIAP